MEAENEYLEALEEGDDQRISLALRKLVREEEKAGLIQPTPRRNVHTQTPTSAKTHHLATAHYDETPFLDSVRLGSNLPGDTPLFNVRGAREWQDTPAGSLHHHHTVPSGMQTLPLDSHEEDGSSNLGPESSIPASDLQLSLDAFQARYTSEDNASFSQILDRANQKRKEKFAWAYEAERKAIAKRRKVIESGRQEADVGHKLAIMAAPESVKRKIEANERKLIEGAKKDGEGSSEIRQKEEAKEEGDAKETKEEREEREEREKEKERSLDLILVPGARKDDRKTNLGVWNFKARNSLMFAPDADISTSTLRSSSLPGHQDKKGSETGNLFTDEAIEAAKKEKPGINYKNTDFIEREVGPGSSGKGGAPDTPRSSKIDAAIQGYAASSSASSQAGASREPPSSTPKVAGFGFVSPLPTPRPGDLGEERMKQLMTWGTIQGTPRIIRSVGDAVDFQPEESPGGSGRAFDLPPRTRREQIAHRLSSSATKSLREKAMSSPRTPSTPYGTAKYSGLALRSSLDDSGSIGRLIGEGGSRPRRDASMLSPAARSLLDRTSKAHSSSFLTPTRTPHASSPSVERGNSSKSRSSLGSALFGSASRDRERMKELERERITQERLRKQRWTPSPSPVARRGMTDAAEDRRGKD
ncbi:hypothetical protein IE53DRAFT_386423 [Violaceomyces palustris]|uniref:Uncharacterized protein n=1 Tax=Violaceomyces palustris TaxID=1673888 RepID=A0ACD0NZJ9_9BASI|nr:hypothetical protein IE53DRAFT_386423 [Violaceomyces palustris]